MMAQLRGTACSLPAVFGIAPRRQDRQERQEEKQDNHRAAETRRRASTAKRVSATLRLCGSICFSFSSWRSLPSWRLGAILLLLMPMLVVAGCAQQRAPSSPAA